jgi:altronate dehydratase large subunit
VEIMGYRRLDGRVGVRNHVLVVSTVFCASFVAHSIAEATGAKLFVHEGGCMELGSQKEHTMRILQGVVNHPNVGGVLVVGLGCEQIRAESVARAVIGKPAFHINVQDQHGVSEALKVGETMVGLLLEQVQNVSRAPACIGDIILATQCGASDAGSGLASNPALGSLADVLVEAGATVLLGETSSLYGAAHVLAERAVSPSVAARILRVAEEIAAYCDRAGQNLEEANPSPGNIAGGLTTLAEKSLGAICKGGTKPVQGVLEAGERPRHSGLWIMNTSLGVDTHATTDMVAGGAQVVAFTTGRGNPVGFPVAPVIKICATRQVVETLDEIVDFDASPVLNGEETLQECSRRLLRELLAVANGKLTKAERSGHSLSAIGTVVPSCDDGEVFCVGETAGNHH